MRMVDGTRLKMSTRSHRHWLYESCGFCYYSIYQLRKIIENLSQGYLCFSWKSNCTENCVAAGPICLVCHHWRFQPVSETNHQPLYNDIHLSQSPIMLNLLMLDLIDDSTNVNCLKESTKSPSSFVSLPLITVLHFYSRCKWHADLYLINFHFWSVFIFKILLCDRKEEYINMNACIDLNGSYTSYVEHM
jgi:hypothetical protein